MTIGKCKTNVLVTVVVPAYNAESYLGEVLEAISLQSYKNIECIVVDDCSTDKTMEIVGSYCSLDKRIRFIQNIQNSGVCVCRNRGKEQAKGEYVVFVDADDIIANNGIAHLISAFEKNDITLSFLSRCRINSAGFIMGEKPRCLDELVVSHINKPTKLLFESNIVGSGSGFMVRASIDIKFDENMRNKANEICGDWDYYLQAAEQGGFIKVKSSFVGYRVHTESMSRSEEKSLESFEYLAIKHSKNSTQLLNEFFDSSVDYWSTLLIRLLAKMKISRFIAFHRIFGFSNAFYVIRKGWQMTVRSSMIVIRRKLRPDNTKMDVERIHYTERL